MEMSGMRKNGPITIILSFLTTKKFSFYVLFGLFFSCWRFSSLFIMFFYFSIAEGKIWNTACDFNSFYLQILSIAKGQNCQLMITLHWLLSSHHYIYALQVKKDISFLFAFNNYNVNLWKTYTYFRITSHILGIK